MKKSIILGVFFALILSAAVSAQQCGYNNANIEGLEDMLQTCNNMYFDWYDPGDWASWLIGANMEECEGIADAIRSEREMYCG